MNNLSPIATIILNEHEHRTNLGWGYCVRIEIVINVIAANMKILSLIQNENKRIQSNIKENQYN